MDTVSNPNVRRRTSDVLIELAEMCQQEKVSLNLLMTRFGDRTFGLILIIISAFNFIPIVSFISGLLVALIGLQMLLGFQTVILPLFVLHKKLPAEKVRKALLKVSVRVRKIEHTIRPRWRFTEAPLVDRLNGLCIMVLGVVITLPVPLINIAPALLIIAMGLGLIERDGLVQMIVLGAAVIIVSSIYFLIQ